MKKLAYYNEHDPFAAKWLRELIKAEHIAPGEVDERSIEDVLPNEIAGFAQCHFFAGISGWSLALRLAGWPDDRPVWTGSAPCQPFSAAGKGEGVADERHLWPAFHHLIKECRPDTIFGEQVDAAIRHGWLDLVQDDLEGIGYAVGAVGLPAASVGAPHLRQRLWFVAESTSERRSEGGAGSGRSAQWVGISSESCELGHTQHTGLEGFARHGDNWNEPGWVKENQIGSASPAGTDGGFWDGAIWHPCRDGKARPIEPSIFPLAHGLPNRVGILRGAGNAIVPQVAAEFIKAFCKRGHQT